MGHIHDESDIKYIAMQVEKHGLQVRYLDAKDRFLRSRNKSKVFKKEHAEYERVIHELQE